MTAAHGVRRDTAIGGDIGETADLVKGQVQEKRTEEDVMAEQAREIQEQEKKIELEEDPELKAAREAAVEARKEVIEAEVNLKEADREVQRLEQQKREKENLDSNDQGAIQGATQTGIDTVR